MLRHIFIKNYALINQLSLNFDSGFTTITGETGAGKSILLGALGLLLGNRADSSIAKNQEEKTIVEAHFINTSKKVETILKENELDLDEELCIRREITKNGKSRAFVNDTPVSLQLLKELSEHLVDIHAQHASLALNSDAFQLQIIDSYAGIKQDVIRFSASHKQLRLLQKKLSELKEEQAFLKKESDYIKFQINELQEAQIQQDENLTLENELNELEHAEEIKARLFSASQILSENEVSVIPNIQSVLNQLKSIKSYSKTIEGLHKRLEEVFIELKDISFELETTNEALEFNPQRLEEVQNRLSAINSLLFKHQVNDVGQLLEILSTLEEKQNNETSIEFEIEKREKEIQLLYNELLKEASFISEKRKKDSAALCSNLQHILKDLGLEKAVFQLKIESQNELNQWGCDVCTFLFSANPGVEPQILTKIASGGELSRCMLALKYMLSKSTQLPSIIFDEIDTGVSGKVADKLGKLLREMSSHMQVFAITHLPQVAGYGHAHFKVVKQQSEKETISNVVNLNQDDRILELAHMLSGEKISDAALMNAKELLQNQ
jgi:DNA repair protein RecN (Recombination protein N)